MTEKNNQNIMYAGADEFICNNENTDCEKHYGGGFSVPSILMKAGLSSVQTVQSGGGINDGKVSDLFQNLAVPSWTTKYNMIFNEYKDEKKNDDSDSDSDIDDDLYEKLLVLAKENEKKLKQKHKKTKKKNEKKNQTKKIKK
jgi:hypothetical protein